MKKSMGDPEGSLGNVLHLVGAALMALLVGVYYFGIYDQFLTRADESENRVELLTSELREANRIRADHYRLQQTFESLETTVTKIRSRLSRPLDKEQLSKALQQAAQEADLEYKLTIGENIKASNHRRLELELKCSGSFGSICSFVDRLGKLAWITDITQLRIETVDRAANYSLLAKFSVYYDRTPTESDKS